MYSSYSAKSLIVFRPHGGNWFVKGPGTGHHRNSKNNETIQLGEHGDIPVAADYFGEGKNRLAVFRPKDGNWYIKGYGCKDWGKTQGNYVVQCGQKGDIPVPFDYFGEGSARVAVFRPSNGTWYIKGPGSNSWGNSKGNYVIQCGECGDIPCPADYFGEQKARLAVFRPSNGNWYIKGPGGEDWGHSQHNHVVQCGEKGDIPVPNDYYGERKARIAVFRPCKGNWYIKGAPQQHDWGKSKGNVVIQTGEKGDIPVPCDYFGEGKARIAVFRPSNGNWYVKGPGYSNYGDSHDNHIIQCGERGDIPTPMSFA